MIRRAAIMALLLACAACPIDNGYAVDITVEIDSHVPEVAVDSITTLVVQVQGAETFDHMQAVKPGTFASRSLRLVYRPALTLPGDIQIIGIALDANGATVCAGAATVGVKPGKTVGRKVVLTSDITTADLGGDGGGGSVDLLPAVKQQGEPCVDGKDLCATGVCADGVCCDKACTDACMACNVPGSVGTCSPIADGGDPAHPSCPALAADDLTKPCSTDGKCDGKGACRLHPLNALCSTESCDPGTNIYTPAAVCDGAGRCITVPAFACDPYVCDGAKCFAACTGTGTTECKPPNQCVDGSCGKLPNGRDCDSDGQCQSGICADGLCCDSRCQGQCEACDADPLQLGTCLPVTGAVHTTNGRTACVGTGGACAGACDGGSRIACTYPGSEVQCRFKSCADPGSGPTETQDDFCDGTGMCPLKTIKCSDRAEYVSTVPKCVGNSCDYTDCASGFRDCTASLGCETNINSDNNNCGGCGTVCGNIYQGSKCSGGSCQCTGANEQLCANANPPRCFVPNSAQCCKPTDAPCNCSRTCTSTFCFTSCFFNSMGQLICITPTFKYNCTPGDCGEQYLDRNYATGSPDNKCSGYACTFNQLTGQSGLTFQCPY